MWLLLAFMSAALLGCYDTFKKISLRDNDVVTVLFLNTMFCSLIFLPFIILSYSTTLLDGTMLHVGFGGWDMHKYIVLKSFIVLSSWLFGYLGMKHLPLTIVVPSMRRVLSWYCWVHLSFLESVSMPGNGRVCCSLYVPFSC